MTVTELSPALSNELQHSPKRFPKINADIGELFAFDVTTVIDKIKDVVAMMTVQVIAPLAKALHGQVMPGGVNRDIARRFKAESNRSVLIIKSESCRISKANLGPSGWRRIHLKEKLLEVRNGGYRDFGG